MAPTRKVSVRQLEKLLDFAYAHQDVAMGRYIGGPFGNPASRLAWENLGLQLNSLGDGVSKTPDQWRRYWIELKAKVKTKAADTRRMSRGINGEPNRLAPLAPWEERILGLIGPVAEGSPDVRISHDSIGDYVEVQTTEDQKHTPSNDPLLAETVDLLPAPGTDASETEEYYTVKVEQHSPSDRESPSPEHKPPIHTEPKTVPRRTSTTGLRRRARLRRPLSSDVLMQRLIELKEEKLRVSKERNEAINRVGDILRKISNKLDEFV
ncbi:uncharacterized protein LOC112049294 isoform X2 [Bicyclus anynana]|uniref:Uncharacterized protein LOC112049294 isoform X2 n=1 Tax=Bicyclus anynana TaxID=110368 RepID=A0A6J1NIC7_BICAN|nr:uncharacterized protein LOC112049294 isoform X2 [Bicyclus anynana]